jgi:3-oxoacyl-ACP reductase-like protein
MTDIDKLVAAIDRLTLVLTVVEGTAATPVATAEFRSEDIETPAPAPAVITAPKATGASGEQPITLNDLRNLAQALLDKGKLASIQKINADHGIKRLSEATSAQINSIHQALTLALA